MSFGENNNNKIYENTYYAKTYLTNYETNKVINVSFSGGLMKISIANREETGKSEEIINASLTGVKANLLVSAMDQMEKDIELGVAEGKAYGVSSGMGAIVKTVAFSIIDGKKCLIIAKVDGSGTISEKTVYDFAKESNYFMNWDNFDTMKYFKQYNEVEYKMFKETLIDFSRNISGAAGYGTLYLNRYEQNRDRNKINVIMDKLGVSVKQNNTSYQQRDNFFNSNNGNKSSDHKSLDDIDAMFSEDD